MTETERWVNGACERIMVAGTVRLYRDLYKDLRERYQCGEACRLVADGLERSRWVVAVARGNNDYPALGARARAIAALRRLARWAGQREVGRLAELYNGI